MSSPTIAAARSGSWQRGRSARANRPTLPAPTGPNGGRRRRQCERLAPVSRRVLPAGSRAVGGAAGALGVVAVLPVRLLPAVCGWAAAAPGGGAGCGRRPAAGTPFASPAASGSPPGSRFGGQLIARQRQRAPRCAGDHGALGQRFANQRDDVIAAANRIESIGAAPHLLGSRCRRRAPAPRRRSAPRPDRPCRCRWRRG